MLHVYSFDLYKFRLLLISVNPLGIELKLAEQLLDGQASAESPAGPCRIPYSSGGGGLERDWVRPRLHKVTQSPRLCDPSLPSVLTPPSRAPLGENLSIVLD